MSVLDKGRRALLPSGARAFLGAMEARFACKRFDPARPLPSQIEEYLLECGRLSPSSFGLEPWKFVAVPGGDLLRGRLFASCFEQEAVGTAALFVAILVRAPEAYEPGSDFLRSRAERFPGGYPVFIADYRGYYDYLASNRLVEHWARSQAYIACSNMMTAAAAAGIDSCAIEGFEEDSLLEALGARRAEWRAAISLVFGYRDETRRERIREPRDSVIERRV